ncbi:MAG: argininosuccinate lyase [Coriobacteriales bacterium]|nr:argininosuccinate lyase [Coriobacteriaceae bacterium]MDY2723445.1 argininosuccinate lyase [Coriobacteriales bacterium]
MAEQAHENDALWGGRFEDAPAEFTQEFGASLPVDKRMWESDIAGSKAHAKMLAKQGIISEKDAEDIRSGLDDIARQIEDGSFDFEIEDEDIHMSIERNLTEAIGAAGGRLHTGRSRNDQVATDTRLHSKKLARGLMHQLLDIRGALLEVATREFGVVMPGYTHMQKAQPVLFSHHMLAYYWMFTRDFVRVRAAYDAADVLPLGSAALAGTTYPLDRDFVADELGFSEVSKNSMDAVSDRDFLLDLTYACSVAMMHLSRMCEEFIYWSSNEFQFIRLSDAYSTGSSIMPQKKNPDFAELIRGKTGRVYGDLMGLLTTLKGLPLAYNKDMQEDKEGVFDAVDTLSDSLVVMTGMIRTMTVNADAMRKGAHGGFMAATDLADYLVGKGMPFRDAHAVVGKLVLECEKQGKTLQELSVDELKQANPLFDAGALDAVDIDKIVARRITAGGTGHDAVKVQLDQARERLTADTARM